MNKNCIQCNSIFIKNKTHSKKYWSSKKFCNTKCSAIYRNENFTVEQREKIRQHLISFRRTGSKITYETKLKLSKSHLGKKLSLKHIESIRIRMKKWWSNPENKQTQKIIANKISKSRLGKYVGENSFNWIKDRTKLKRSNDRRKDSNYIYWSKGVKKRDKFKCKITDKNCKGNLQAHHILNWVDYPELRYEINNGITLCHAHHPRGRVKEKRLSPYFQELVTASK